MPHWRLMMEDKEFLFAYHLQNRDVTLTISSVTAGALTGEGGRKTKKPIIQFKERDKKFALNSTNAKTIAAMYTNETDNWIGKRITLYPTTTQMGGETVECIRVRNVKPKQATKPDLADQIRDQMASTDAGTEVPQ